MITFEEAYKLVKNSVATRDVVEIDMLNSIGAVLAEDVFSDVDMPPFNKSAMDGFAVRSSDLKSVPCTLDVMGEVRAGFFFDGRVGQGQAVRIMTGAPVPYGADAVVMVEYTEMLPGDKVKIDSVVGPGENICLKAEDVSKGTKVLSKGTLIGSSELSVLATVGKNTIRSFRRPKVSVITTGDELVGVDETPERGQIRNCNGPLLVAMLIKEGFEVSDLGIAVDNEKTLREISKKGLESDLLLLTGGVSEGVYDLIPDIMESLGVRKIFHKVAMKPGKPLYFGESGGRYVFGMPGNPMSTFLAYRIFVKLALNKMIGLDGQGLFTENGLLTEDIEIKKGERKKFIPVKADYADGKWLLRPAGHHGSADIFSLARSDSFAVVEAGTQRVEAGTVLEFIRW